MGSADIKSQAPDALIWLRVSRNYLATYVEREVDLDKAARDNVLGITFVGQSRTTGKTRLELKSSEEGALAEVVFEGHIHSRTSGSKGPATLHYHSNSQVRATKQIVIGERGLETRPTVAQTPTRLTLVGLNTSLPGLRGLLAERIARRRAAASLAQANAIVSDHRKSDVSKSLDDRLNRRVAEIQSHVTTRLATMKLEGGVDGTVLRSRSTPDFLEVVIYRSGQSSPLPNMPHFEVKGNPDIALRVHRRMLAHIVADSELRARLVSSLGQVIQSGLIVGQVSGRHSNANSSLESEWLAYDIANADPSGAPARMAAGNSDETRLHLHY